MGTIIDLDFPAATTALPPRRQRQRKLHPRIEVDTPIVPHAVATFVWEEACVWLQEELPREWVTRLTVRANLLYARNARFRALLQRDGDIGLDGLWAFTRHWLAALLKKYRPGLYAKLPASYSGGAVLPAKAIGWFPPG